MTSPQDEEVAPVLMEILEAPSGTELRNIVQRHPAILTVDLTPLSQALRELGSAMGGGMTVTAAIEHRVRLMERLGKGGLASMTPERWSGNPDGDWVLPLSLALALDVVAVMLHLATAKPGVVPPDDLVTACRQAWNHPAMAAAPPIVRAGVGRDLAVALRLQLRVNPQAGTEQEAARLEAQARDHGIRF